MPLFAVDDELPLMSFTRDSTVGEVIWWGLTGNNILGPIGSVLFPYASMGDTPKIISRPINVTPGKSFYQGGVLAITYYLPDGITSQAKQYVKESTISVSGAKVIGFGPANDGDPKHYIVMVSKDTSWVSVTKVRRLWMKLREIVASGVISQAQEIVTQGRKLSDDLFPKWLNWLIEHPVYVVVGIGAIYLAPHILGGAAKIKRSYKEYKAS